MHYAEDTKELEETPLDISHRYDVVGTAPAPAFDEIVRLATAICDAPIAAINFVNDDHRCIQAVTGLPDGDGADPAGICALVSPADTIMVIPDLIADERFRDYLRAHPENSVRFYAATSLVAPDGGHVGTLCVLDWRPRDLTKRQRSLLKVLASRVITELELRRSLAAQRLARRDAEQLLAEKDRLLEQNHMLMQEVDHRVKNSLQMVSSMLRLQAHQLSSIEGTRALEQAQRRIASVAAAHEQLYRASGSDMVDMSVFLDGICKALAAHRPSNIDGIEVQAEPIVLGSKRAMKTGMLVAELVMNGLKHAYPAGRHGSIRVELRSAGPIARLSVSDDGVGLPSDFLVEGGKGLGMRLIRSIVEQFEGKITVEPGPSARFVVDIPKGGASTE
ncbi:sensor histidine kinase [Mesorhizobium humile]|uniref:histidine kinase n=1 Tax=Mesorhizobium humile TaxID=3072313 RepID=A0ABU4YHN9_9HYPH|nr:MULTISPECIES: histidine kinase dimerization/phosphoacceptor domain -containing protein [unclassified Mesorhizobium]MDX8457591.1 histidine kinase dimerization/phosphoacceptor domain -containing protein [Mesorhizobium sp. VK2D]MDX8485600.1 histidine kinase dimerization/phosphoacceptor domain -containing protein [Mesorhizobium sp. VK2B]